MISQLGPTKGSKAEASHSTARTAKRSLATAAHDGLRRLPGRALTHPV
jgi:hypothetical protein